MNTPLIRPLRGALQGRLFATARPTRNALPRPLTQVRRNASTTSEDPPLEAQQNGRVAAPPSPSPPTPLPPRQTAKEGKPTSDAAAPEIVTTEGLTADILAAEAAEEARAAKAVKKAHAAAGVPAMRADQTRAAEEDEEGDDNDDGLRLPRSVAALYLKPLRREAHYGVPSCDLQMRSYSLPNLEFFCDFALRAAFYLGLPAFGPVPLPRKIERWTVPRSSFIFKKSQENFERITMRRLIQIRDGHPETVQIWLAYLQKHQMYGVGMKANMWEFNGLDVAERMDQSKARLSSLLKDQWKLMGHAREDYTVPEVQEQLAKDRRAATGGR